MMRPRNTLVEYMQRVDYAQRAMEKEMLVQLRRQQDLVASMEKRLFGLNPRHVLSRGYAAVMDAASGKPITSIKGITMGQPARIVLRDGTAEAMFTGSVKEENDG